MNPLIPAEELQRLLDGPTPPVVLDAGFDLADPQAGRRDFEAGHIPGAQHADLDADLCGTKTGRNGRHPLPDREAFAATVGRWGIGAHTPVVVYDRQGGAFAARLWWMLRWMGHADVRVLDGAWAAWLAAGGRVETGGAPARHGTPPYPPGAPRVATLPAEALLAHLGDTGLRLIDARTPERFRGESEPIDPVAGHIPGAVNRCFKDNLGPDGRFKPAAQLREEFTALLDGRPAQAAVHQCGSGVTACHNLLAMEAAGLAGSALYPGSWSEWCADPARPVARGHGT